MRILTRERFGRAQILAGILLVIFLGECGWLIAHETPGAVSADEYSRVQEGLAQWRAGKVAGTPQSPADASAMRAPIFDVNHSPLWYLTETVLPAMFMLAPERPVGFWLMRVPYVFIGLLLGASIWYVSRRLYGNAGGFIALTLYCFSPAVLRSSTLWASQPNVAAAWGTFGAVFTAIAVSHTLYAPREVVLWNWRRICLLGISLALAVGSQFSLVIVLPLLLLMMFYLAPARKAAATAIFSAAVVLGMGLLFASYFGHPRLFWQGMSSAIYLDVSGRALAMAGAYLQAGKELAAAGPVLAVLAPAALVAYVGWSRSRYFGNTAPLIFAVLFALLRVATPHEADSVFSLLAAVFCFIFISGIAADVLETRAREIYGSILAGLLAANAVWNLIGLARIGRGF